MKKLIFLFAVFSIALLVGCGRETKQNNDETNKKFSFVGDIYYFYYGGKYGSRYLNERHNETSYIYVKFHKDGLIEWIDAGEESPSGSIKTNKYYGKYEKDGRMVKIIISGDESVSCVVSDDGKSISIGNERLKMIDETTSSSKHRLALMKFD